MQLFVIRHAVAEDAGPDQDDVGRKLTSDGVRKLRKVVRGMRRLGWTFDRVLTSPWTRAMQTAAQLAPLCEDDPVITDLLCQAPRAELLAMIAERGEDTAVVGHEPWLGELVAWLAFGDMRHGEMLAFKKPGVVWLEGNVIPGGMKLRALVPPQLLRDLS